jgi:hypothetical protein
VSLLCRQYQVWLCFAFVSLVCLLRFGFVSLSICFWLRLPLV